MFWKRRPNYRNHKLTGKTRLRAANGVLVLQVQETSQLYNPGVSDHQDFIRWRDATIEDITTNGEAKWLK